jgi:hypothetical protein
MKKTELPLLTIDDVRRVAPKNAVSFWVWTGNVYEWRSLPRSGRGGLLMGPRAKVDAEIAARPNVHFGVIDYMETIKKNPIPKKDRGHIYAPGTRVQLHPGTDRWMRGDRYGEVVKHGRKLVTVLMDRSGQKIKIHPSQLMMTNPKRRGIAPARVRRSGRKFRITATARSPLFKRSRRFRSTTDPRKIARTMRRAGLRVNPKRRRTRVNPTARRAAYIVSAKRAGASGFTQQASFIGKPAALQYARMLARANPSATVKVEARK